MKSLIRWAVLNTPAMNTLMLAIICIGLFSLFSMRREVFPEFELEIVLVTVPYPGASPDEVEEGICQKIEEAVRSIDGIKKQTSVAKEGLGAIILELRTDVDPQRIVNEVRSEVERIPSFPLLAEDPEVEQITLRDAAITVGIIGPDDDQNKLAEWQLREVAESIRDDLTRLPTVSIAKIIGAKDFEIDVEISEQTLRRYGLTLNKVAEIIRSENLELPAGTIRTSGQDILVKGKNKGNVGTEIEKIPLITDANGVVLTVADLGTVRDEFADIDVFTRINGRPGMAITVERSKTEDLLALTDDVNEYVRSKKMPTGYELITWSDRSIEVRDRLRLLSENGVQGLILVVVTLSFFMNLRLSCWVGLGIPISILGACAVLYFNGDTLNMLTTFTFVMALGIVVDDSIVISENIHSHRMMGKSPVQAAIDGTQEVAAAVVSSVATTIIAFLPLAFVTGVMGKFIAVMPLTMIATLLFSLFEAIFVLPCHLAHETPEGEASGPLAAARRINSRISFPFRWTIGLVFLAIGAILEVFVYPIRRISKGVDRLNVATDYSMRVFSNTLYSPALAQAVKFPAVTLSVGAVILMLAFSLVKGGIVQFNIFPKVDSNTIEANITFPDGTPTSVADAATLKLENAIKRIHERYSEKGEPVLNLTRRSVGYVTIPQGPGTSTESSGSHIGAVTAQLRDVTQRNVHSEQILSEWRTEAGEFPGSESIIFGASAMGPGGTPIEFKLLANAEDMDQLEAAVERVKARLNEFNGVFDVRDDSRPGKWEFQLKIKEDAVAMGVPLQTLAQTVRASYYGEEVMRLQRGRHEVKLMVRYPRDERRSLTEFDQIRIRGNDGVERPLTELADVTIDRSYSEVNRVNQRRSITISADIDEGIANASDVVRTLKSDFMPKLFEELPGVDVRWEGQQEQTEESVQSLLVGMAVALVAMFVLLTLQFNSYFQPLLILAIIPFALAGAIAGHALMGMPLTLFSLFGLVTLTGIVVNDSIVLVDFINQKVKEGTPIREAILESGVRRLRPILLTSVTTIAGLFPLVLETSAQAQILIPMAVSICFGLAFTTFLVLIFVPTFYLLHAQVTGRFEQELKELHSG